MAWYARSGKSKADVSASTVFVYIHTNRFYFIASCSWPDELSKLCYSLLVLACCLWPDILAYVMTNGILKWRESRERKQKYGAGRMSFPKAIAQWKQNHLPRGLPGEVLVTSWRRDTECSNEPHCQERSCHSADQALSPKYLDWA